MQSLLARTKTFLTPSGSSANLHESGKFRTEKDASLLFPRTTPEVDGDDCLHDCASCTEQLPRKWSIDEEDSLYGHVNGWETHLVIGTGKTDWVRDVKDEKGSLMEAVGKIGQELANGKLMISASNMPSTSDHGTNHSVNEDYPNEGRTKCILLPQWKVVEHVSVNDAPWLIQDVIAKGVTNSTPISKVPVTKPQNGEYVVQKEAEPVVDTAELNGPTLRDDTVGGEPAQLASAHVAQIPAGVTMQPLQHRAIILMCSHGTRDWRCGKSAPILEREFKRHLRPLGLARDFDDPRPGGVGVYFINHVGGHKYSANVMIYRRSGSGQTLGDSNDEAVQGIWLARVRPEDCENIVKYTIMQGKLVKPQRQLRGGFDRQAGVLSW